MPLFYFFTEGSMAMSPARQSRCCASPPARETGEVERRIIMAKYFTNNVIEKLLINNGKIDTVARYSIYVGGRLRMTSNDNESVSKLAHAVNETILQIKIYDHAKQVWLS